MVAFVTTNRLKAMISEAESQGVFLCGVDEKGQLTGLGKQLNKIGHFDLTAESFSKGNPISNYESTPTVQPAATRATGNRFFEYDGKRTYCKSTKLLLKKGLIFLEKKHPGMLEDLQKIRPRSKRIVAKNKYDLFKIDRRDLAENNSEILMDDWWVGTNNSSQEVSAWLQRACEVAGINFGLDFKIGGM